MNPQKQTARWFLLLIVIIWQECGWTWVGRIIWIALGVNRTHPHRVPRDYSYRYGPHCVTVATGQTRGGASVLHLVVPAALTLLQHACSVCVYMCVCPYANSFARRELHVYMHRSLYACILYTNIVNVCPLWPCGYIRQCKVAPSWTVAVLIDVMWVQHAKLAAYI